MGVLVGGCTATHQYAHHRYEETNPQGPPLHRYTLAPWVVILVPVPSVGRLASLGLSPYSRFIEVPLGKHSFTYFL